MSIQEFTRQWLSALLDPPPVRVRIDCLRQGWGQLHTGQSIHGTPFCLHGRTFAGGLGVHADSEVAVSLDAPARRLRAWVGVDDNEATRRTAAMGLPPAVVVFSVEADGRQLWQSPPMTLIDPPAEVNLALDGVSSFTLKAEAVNGETNHAHVDWADARVEFTDGSEAALGESLATQCLPRRPVFSFRLNGRPSGELLPHWPVEAATEADADGVTLRRLTYRDPEAGLAVVWERKEFADFPAAEWLVRFRNDGTADTPLLEDIRCLDIAWAATEETWLHRSHGSDSSVDDFAYQKDRLPAGATLALDSRGGRPSTNWLPFFSLQTGDRGVTAALGWTGQWAAEVSRDDAELISVRAGMERTHLVLHPGEEIRTPSTALLFWEGKPINGSNLLRRFLAAHHTARTDGQRLQAPLSSGSWGGVKTETHLENIRRIHDQRIPYDVYWIDAGWYGTPESYSAIEFTGKWWSQVGNWSPNPVAHPGGMRPIGDAAEAAGLQFLLWFEPERAIWGTQVTQEHPEWFLGDPTPGHSALLNLGNAEAREWLTEFVSGRIDDWKIKVFRQDFNMDPVDYWRLAEAPDRQGMTEIGHVQGLYAFWDELLRRHPGLLIDNCASGGRRIDLETTGRSIPLWRSDYQCVPGALPLAAQCHTFGLSHWLPLSGTLAHLEDGSTYDFRSALSAALSFNSALPEWRAKMMADYRRARPLWFGDFYPLTRYSTATDVWCAFQLHRADLGEGLTLAFRREECPFTRAVFALDGLEPEAEYRLEDADTGETWVQAGGRLADGGLTVTIDEARQSRLIFYAKNIL